MLSALRTTTACAALLAAVSVGCDEPRPDDHCAPGNAGCACLPDDLCTGSLTCHDGLCRAVDRRAVEVLDPSARSCELVLEEDGTEVLDVSFGAGVAGTSIHEAPRTAIAFHRETDTAFPSGAVTVSNTDGTGRISIRRARCFDRNGTELTGEPVRVGG